MLQLRTISVPKIMFIASAVALVLASLWVRWYLPLTLHFRLTQEQYNQMEAQVLAQHDSPDLTSSVMPGSDALAGLGGDWTYLDSQQLTGKEPPLLAGTVPTRSSHIKVVGKSMELSLNEGTIKDAKLFAATRAQLKAQPLNLAGRNGYLLTPAGIRPSFLIEGNTTMLLISNADANFNWKASLPTEIASYIATVTVP